MTYKRLLAIKLGVNFDTCLRLLPYWDVVRCFAMDVLHDIFLGPVRAALEETFGRENLSDSDPVNMAHKLRLPKSIGASARTTLRSIVRCRQSASWTSARRTASINTTKVRNG